MRSRDFLGTVERICKMSLVHVIESINNFVFSSLRRELHSVCDRVKAHFIVPHVDRKRLRLVTIEHVHQTVNIWFAVDLLNQTNLVWISCTSVDLNITLTNPEGLRCKNRCNIANQVFIIGLEEVTLGDKLENI